MSRRSRARGMPQFAGCGVLIAAHVGQPKRVAAPVSECAHIFACVPSLWFESAPLGAFHEDPWL